MCREISLLWLRLLKFAGYIYNHKILPENIFGLILKNKMIGILGRDLKFARYVYHYEILPENNFWPYFEKTRLPPGAFLCQSLKVLISPLLLVWESSDVVRFDLGPLLQGQTRIAKQKLLITHLLLVLQVCNVKPISRKSWARNFLMWSELTLGPSFKVK